MSDVATPLPLFTSGVRKRPRPKSWRENLSSARQVAIKAWLSLIKGCEFDSVVGRQLLDAVDD